MQEPQVLKLEKRELDIDNYKRRSASESDYEMLVDASTVVRDVGEGKVSIVYLELEEDHSPVVQALKRISYNKDSRTRGMMTRSRVFGFMPRNTIRRDYCTATSLLHEDPDAHQLVMRYADKVARQYEQFNPELYAEHQRQVERVLPDYKIGKSVFTSGIINKNNPLPYHHDAGNFKNAWSNMLVFKHRTTGGYLSVPEYGLGFELKDNSLLMFDGQSILHGVTPIQKFGKQAYRYSIVFYSLQQMWQCLTPEEEMKRYRKVRSEREYKRLAPVEK